MDIPKTMYAMQLTGFGDVDKLQYVEIETPQPEHNEVLIRVGACGLNNTDLNLRKAWYSSQDKTGKQTSWQHTEPDFPIIQGADIVGEIVSAGADVDAARIGQRVMVNPTIYNDNPENPLLIDFIGSERSGGFAEYVCVPSSNAYVVNSRLTDAELATFATAYLTAEHMLERANVQAGETILVTGASGGVGSALLQLVRVRQAETIAVIGRGKATLARELGAIDVVFRDEDDLESALVNHAIDVVADVIGGSSIVSLMNIVRAGGRIVTCGAIADPIVEIDLRTLYLRQISLIGSTLGTASEFLSLIEYINANQVKPLLAKIFPLDELREAQRAFEAKQFFGKIVIVP